MKTDNGYLERAKEIISTAGIRNNSIAIMAIKYIFPELNQENTGDDAKSRNHKDNREFPVIAKVKNTGELVIVNGGILAGDGSDEYVRYNSYDGHCFFEPDEIIFYDEYENDSEKKKETSDFNVGDWIVEELSGEWLVVTDEAQFTYTAETISGKQFIIQKDGTKHNGYHSWTQDDASPGDVLADYAPNCDNPLIFILKDFKHIKYNLAKESDYHSFCYLKANEKQQFCTGSWHHIHDLKPATAKQQELLFNKMKDAGYSWKPDNLELSKTKLEPKFKIGDWIVYCKEGAYREIMYIYDIKDNRYYLNDNMHFSWSIKECDEKCHIWSIKDAKAGDVLACAGSLFIYKEEYMAGKPTAYCGLVDGVFHISNLGCWTNEKCYPATDGQRELLLSKIKKAGWSWNPDTLELSKK